MGRRGRTRGGKGGSQWRMRGWRGEEVTERLVKERGVVEVRERKRKGRGKVKR